MKTTRNYRPLYYPHFLTFYLNKHHHYQVSVALNILADKLEACTDVMPPQDMSNALFGLQGISYSNEIKIMLNVLISKMKLSDGIYSGRDIGYSLAGLSSMQPIVHDEVQEIFEELCMKVARSEFQGQPNLLFLQFGKGVRVKKADKPLTLIQAQELIEAKKKGDRLVRV
jgi:hypothetical protein